MLGGWLEYHRATLAVKCEGLDRRPAATAGGRAVRLSLLGLVRHMGEVETQLVPRVWAVAREDAPPRFYDDTNIDGDFDDVDTADVAEAFTYWREECQNARTVEASFESLDECGWDQTARRHLAALGADPHDRGVRPPQRPRRPPPRAHRRHHRRVSRVRGRSGPVGATIVRTVRFCCGGRCGPTGAKGRATTVRVGQRAARPRPTCSARRAVGASAAAAAAARRSAWTVAIAAVIAATCSGGGGLARRIGVMGTPRAASCRACAAAAARASCAASRTRRSASCACRAGR